MRESIKIGIRRILKTGQYSLNDPIEKKLPSMRQPTLVIRGENDPLVTQAWAEKVIQLLPKAKLVVIPNVGHVVNFNSPDVVAGAILKFTST